MTPGLFITGTGTEVGKTYVAACVARALVGAGRRVGVYKPVASGCRSVDGQLVSDDAVALWEAAGCPGTVDQVCPQRFAAPIAPHRAAWQEGTRVDADRLRDGLKFWQSNSDIVLVEGAGGLMSPLSDEDYNADLATDFGFPLVVVAANELGTINQTLQTLITAATFCDGLQVAGIVLNQARRSIADDSRLTNEEELANRCVPPLLTTVRWQAPTTDRPVDWFALATESGRNGAP